MNSNLLRELLERRVTRKEFLAYIGAAILALVGITKLLNSFGISTKQESINSGPSGAYGGKKNSKLFK